MNFMMGNVRRLLIGYLSLLSSPLCFAGQWEAPVIEVEAMPMDPAVEVIFHYIHDGAGLDEMPKVGVLPEGVKLLPATVSTTPLLMGGAQKEAVDMFRFQIPVGCLSGEHAISIPLATSTEPKELKVILKVPEVVEIKPRRLIWKRGDASESKTASVVSVTREGVVLTKVEPSDDAFDVILERKAAQLYSVKITPKDVASSKRTVIRVRGIDLHGRETSFNLYAEVR